MAKKLSSTTKKSGQKKATEKSPIKDTKKKAEPLKVSLKGTSAEETKGKEALKVAVSKKKPIEKKAESKSKATSGTKKPMGTSKSALKEKLQKEAAAAQFTELGKKWLSLFQTADVDDAKPYKMTEVYDSQTAIHHEVLGWGFILSKNNDRLEVIFKDGVRQLISNYRR